MKCRKIESLQKSRQSKIPFQNKLPPGLGTAVFELCTTFVQNTILFISTEFFVTLNLENFRDLP